MVIGLIELAEESSRHQTSIMEVGVNFQLQTHAEPGAGSNTATIIARMDHQPVNHSNGLTPAKSNTTSRESPMKKDEATPSPSKDTLASLLSILLEKDKEASQYSPPPFGLCKTTSLEENKKPSIIYSTTLNVPSAGYARRNSLDGTLRTNPTSPRYDKPIMNQSFSVSKSQLVTKPDAQVPEIRISNEGDPLMKEFSEIQQLFDRMEKSAKRLAEDYGKLSEGSSGKDKLMEDYQQLRSENTRLVHQVTQLNLVNQKSQLTIETLTKSKTQENSAKMEQLLSIIHTIKNFINSQNVELPENIKQQLEGLEAPSPAISHKKSIAVSPVITSGPTAPPTLNSSPRNSTSSNKSRVCKTTGKAMNQLVFGPLNFSDSQPSALTSKSTIMHSDSESDGSFTSVKSNISLKTSTDRVIFKDERRTLKPTSEFVTPLLTDMYQISMAYAYWKSKKHEEMAVFDLFFRSNPFKGEFTVFAGLEEVIRFISNFRFTDDDIAYLEAVMADTCEKEFFHWLKTVDCSKIRLHSIPEGTVCFPKSPIMRIEGPLAVGQLLETTLLTLVNYPSLVCTNAARHRLVAGPQKVLLEFGLRRAQGVDGGISATRYSYMGGFNGTSNVLASKLFGIPPKGTHAHAFVSSFIDEEDLKVRTLVDSKGHERDFYQTVLKYKQLLKFQETNHGELVAFTAYAIAFPKGLLALVDTYDTLKSGVPNFIIVACALHDFGYKALGVRLDSGDLAYLSVETRKIFQVFTQYGMDPKSFQIVASNDINEATLISLNQQGHEIDCFGIGTNLVTCQAQPALGCVYKLVDIKGEPRIKISQEVSKVTIPGRKETYRLHGTQPYPIIDIMVLVDTKQKPQVGKKILCLHPFDPQKRAFVTPTQVEKLHECFWDCGKVMKELPSLEEIRARVLQQLKEMRADHIRYLNPTPYKVSVTEELYNLLHGLWLREVPIPDISL